MSITPSAGSNSSVRLIPAARPTSTTLVGNDRHQQQRQFQPSATSLTALTQLLESLKSAKGGDNLRALRNKLLGHEALKRFLVERGELVERLVPFITSDNNRSKTPLTWQREAVVILGSIAYGGTSELNSLLKNNIPQLLLTLITKAELEEEGRKLRESAMRALRTIYRHVETPRELPFHPQLLPLLTKLLGEGEGKTREYCAVMLANCCDVAEKQVALGSLGAIVIALRMAVTRGLPFSSLEAALDLLASLTRDNYENCKELVSSSTAITSSNTGNNDTRSNLGESVPNSTTFLFEILTRRTNAEIRIFASICLSNLCRCGLLQQQTSSNQGETDARVVKILIPCLISLLAEGIPVRARAAEVLALLMSDSERLQIVACDSEVIGKLAQMLTHPSSDEERKAALLAFAAISSFKEECRRMVIEAKVLPLVLQAMDHPSEAIRAAACQATRSLSRSVKNLRTALVDAGMCTPLMRLLFDASVAVQKTACAALCNLVLDFSPMKEAVLKEGGVGRLVELTGSGDAELRGNALWALKNLLYLADTPIKLATMEQLTFDHLERLANDVEVSVQEQALNLLRNLVCEKEADISEVLTRLGEVRLIKLIERKITSKRDDIVMHACYVIANACTASTSAPKDAVMASAPILDRISSLLLSDVKGELQVAALWCVINLTWTEDAGSSDRISKLRRTGVERLLEQLMASSLTADVRDRVQTAVNNFNALNTGGAASGGTGGPLGGGSSSTTASSRRHRNANNNSNNH